MNRTTLLIIAILVLGAIAMARKKKADEEKPVKIMDELSALRAQLLASPATPATVADVLNDPYAAPEIQAAAGLREAQRQGMPGTFPNLKAIL